MRVTTDPQQKEAARQDNIEELKTKLKTNLSNHNKYHNETFLPFETNYMQNLINFLSHLSLFGRRTAAFAWTMGPATIRANASEASVVDTVIPCPVCALRIPARTTDVAVPHHRSMATNLCVSVNPAIGADCARCASAAAMACFTA